MSDETFFNLHNMEQGLKRSLSEGIETRIFPGEQAMISVVRIAPNAEGKLHSHPEEQWGVVIEGGGIRSQGGRQYTVGKGDFWRTPGNVQHTFRGGSEGAVILDVFAPPREEYRKAGSGFGEENG